MKLLFITPTLPHSRVYSGSIVIHHRMRLLAERGYKLGLATFLKPEDKPFLDEVRAFAPDLETRPVPPPLSFPRILLSHTVGSVPWPFARYNDPAMAACVGAMVARGRYDAAIAEFTAMGQFLYRNPFLPAVRRIVSVHGCAANALRKSLHVAPVSLARLGKQLALPRLEQWEMALYRSADLVLTLTETERQELLALEPNIRTAVSPYGVDVERFRPLPGGDEAREEAICFTGFFRDEPNCDAVLWFVQEVWPALRKRFPKLIFYVIGSSPPPAITELGRRRMGIVVTGEVDDMAPYLARCLLYVCPLRIGVGFSGKILQAMSAGLPVVATSLAAQGFPVEPGHNIMLADTPSLMIANISLLLTDRILRAKIADRAREMVIARFSWPRCVDTLEAALREVVS
mgnify:CR=1 FL=1